MRRKRLPKRKPEAEVEELPPGRVSSGVRLVAWIGGIVLLAAVGTVAWWLARAQQDVFDVVDCMSAADETVDPNSARHRQLISSCARIYQIPACRQAYDEIAYGDAGSDHGDELLMNGCVRPYCDVFAEPKPALCARTRMPTDELERFDLWNVEFLKAAWSHDYPVLSERIKLLDEGYQQQRKRIAAKYVPAKLSLHQNDEITQLLLHAEGQPVQVYTMRRDLIARESLDSLNSFVGQLRPPNPPNADQKQTPPKRVRLEVENDTQLKYTRVTMTAVEELGLTTSLVITDPEGKPR